VLNFNNEELRILLSGMEKLGGNEFNWEIQNKIITEINKSEELDLPNMPSITRSK